MLKKKKKKAHEYAVSCVTRNNHNVVNTLYQVMNVFFIIIGTPCNV